MVLSTFIGLKEEAMDMENTEELELFILEMQFKVLALLSLSCKVLTDFREEVTTFQFNFKCLLVFQELSFILITNDRLQFSTTFIVKLSLKVNWQEELGLL